MIRSRVLWIHAGWAMLGWVLLFFWIWFVGWFSPLQIVRTDLIISDDGQDFIFHNYSRKTPFSSILCGKPTLSIVIFSDMNLETKSVSDIDKEYGTGSSRIKRWETKGQIPEGLAGGEIDVHKKLSYPCIFDTSRDVVSETKSFTLNR